MWVKNDNKRPPSSSEGINIVHINNVVGAIYAGFPCPLWGTEKR